MERIETEYCLRPSNDDHSNDWWSEGIPSTTDQKYTFDQLVQLNITARQIFSWSTSVALVEQYQDYLNQRDSRLASKEIFRCIASWFGSRCQYLFELPEDDDLSERITEILELRFQTEEPEHMTYLSCYTLLHCQENGKAVCLHWSQICDGTINCIDGEEDETSCFIMEINECKSNEYRCHNGQCIPGDFALDYSSACLDRSEQIYLYGTHAHLLHPSFFWKQYGCLPGAQTLACGDGECVKDLDSCKNGRYPFLTSVIAPRSNLTTDCWMIMICLTRLMDEVNEISCSQLIQSDNTSRFLTNCNPLIRFPEKPVLLHHVHFLFRRDDLLAHSPAKTALPAYICFDPQLCEHLSPTFHGQNLSCRTASEMGLDVSDSSLTWTSIMDTIRPYFYGCLLQVPDKDYRQHPSLYCCHNSSKCISQHRIIDGIIDCPYHDDEHAVSLSCSIKHAYRFRCHNEEQCRSPISLRTNCPSGVDLHIEKLLFQDICNGIVEMTPELINGRNHTDETDCHAWPCNNIYTRCDHSWNCPNGEDEIDCVESSSCPIHTLDCVSPSNHTLMCLPPRQVGDGIIDCLGGGDERTNCRRSKGFFGIYPGFQCFNDTNCLLPSYLCDGRIDCRFGDDEVFCEEHGHKCRQKYFQLPRNIDRALCRVARGQRPSLLFGISIVPLSKKINDIVSIPVPVSPSHLQPRTAQINATDSNDVWYCHHGLPAALRLSPNLFNTRCYCPPDFYGDRCQYQSQQVIVTLKVQSAKRWGVRAFLTSLISYDHDHEELHSHHISSYVLGPCKNIFQFFLLYSTRPKNISKNYFVKIDGFDQLNSTYLGSWRFPVPFLFLPVNPMALLIRVPYKPLSTHYRCPLKCGSHGRCVIYLNNEEIFCRCDSGWSGNQCEQPVNCHGCGSNSLCLGSHYNRSICLCSIGTFGSRCLLEYSCPDDRCQNGGTCVMQYPHTGTMKYQCLCSEKFIGPSCEYRQHSLTVSFQDIKISSYVMIYVPANDDSQLPRAIFLSNVVAENWRIFQTSISFYTDRTFSPGDGSSRRKLLYGCSG